MHVEKIQMYMCYETSVWVVSRGIEQKIVFVNKYQKKMKDKKLVCALFY